MAQDSTGTWAPPRRPSGNRRKRHVGWIVYWTLVGLVLAALVTSVAVPVVDIQPYTEQSTSMQNTLAPGDRLFAVPADGVRRGDVIVFRMPTRVSRTGALAVKRVIGLPGDRVACCNSHGRLTVDGKALDETYLYPGDPPSRFRFSVTVGRGHVWVMGDHRNISADSREWGAIPESGIVGRVVFVAHGSSVTVLRTPQAFVADGLAPRDTRVDFYLRLAFLGVSSAAALLVLAIVGTTCFMVRRRRSRRVPPSGQVPPPRQPQAAPAPLEPMWGVYRGVPDPPDRPVLPS
jgi:signal peptidase I